MNQHNTLAPPLRARNVARLLAQAESAASAKPFDTVTQINLAPLFGEATEATAAAAAQIRDACLEVGFFSGASVTAVPARTNNERCLNAGQGSRL